MKKLALMLATIMTLIALCACNAEKSGKDGIKIVTTIFPEYDWVKNVMGDRAGEADITLLLDNGVDLHSYQPTAEDMLEISNCDLFIYVGGESDEWVDDALKSASNKNMKVVNLMEVLGDKAYEEELKEGMQGEEEEEEGEEEAEYDEHVWLSLKNAKVFVRKIADELKDLDPASADTFEKNASEYISKLNDLDSRYEEVTGKASVKTLLFGDRFPFRYMTEDYGLDYYAAFIGCSAETEASFETIAFLSAKADELGLKYIFTIDNSDQKIAKTIIDNTQTKDAQILVLNSMQSTDKAAIDNGADYLTIMEENLNVLSTALG